MYDIRGFEGFGNLIEVPVKSLCKDGRKVPLGIDLDRFMQLNVYQWLKRLPYGDTIFTYNPFRTFPITTRSIVDTIDQDRVKYRKSRHRKGSYYLRRVFDNTGENLDPLDFAGECVVIFDSGMPAGDLYFQCNCSGSGPEKAGLILTTRADLARYFQTVKQHETFSGNLERKERF
jgi:hypothetical protein